MEHVAATIEAASSPWGVVALLLLGFFALTWKYGKEILQVMRETRNASQATHNVVRKVEQSIVTNHGSKNLGDAVDRLTGWYMEDRVQLEEDRRLMRGLTQRLDQHISDCEPLNELISEIQSQRETQRAHH